MNSTERVRRVITGQSADRTPIYGWCSGNFPEKVTEYFGSPAALEDRYEFDAAHIFGGPATYNEDSLNEIRASGVEFTPDLLLDLPLMDPNHMEDYEEIKKSMAFHKERDRFCYMQTPGFFESHNGYLGIENHLYCLAEYPDELKELYARQLKWNKQFASNLIDLGVDMVHISDDWGAQNSLMFSPRMWWDMVYPNMKEEVDFIHSRGCFASLHSDGCVRQVADGIADIGFDVVHPWQENAGMSYDLYLEKYQDKFAILGGLCVQSTIGFGNYERLESEIRRVFRTLKGKRWIMCTSHFIQPHCTMEEIEFAYDLIYKLARE